MCVVAASYSAAVKLLTAVAAAIVHTHTHTHIDLSCVHTKSGAATEACRGRRRMCGAGWGGVV